VKRFFALLVITSLVSILHSPISRAENQIIEVPGFASLEYPKLVKLSKTNCQNIPIKYEINQELDIENAALLIQIGYIKKKQQAGYTAWFGNIPGSSALTPMPMIGGLKLKVCKKQWKLKDEIFIGVKPGSYDVYIAYGIYQINSSVQKKVITEKIKFTR
jgi:hypothetical protein